MASRQCLKCMVRWPSRWANCPACGQKTVHKPTLPPDRNDSEANHAAFEGFYKEHDRSRTGPSPEEIGRREAQQVIELERNLVS